MKLCRRCGETKPFELFSNNKTNNDGLQSWCKECVNEYTKDYYQKNRTRILARQKANPEVGRKSAEIWRNTHPDLYRERIEAWREANPEKKREYAERRRALLSGANATLTSKEWADIWVEFDGKCFWCGDIATEMEHIVPLQPRPGGLAGHHVKGNVVPSCAPCNDKKHNKDPLLFLFEQRGF